MTERRAILNSIEKLEAEVAEQRRIRDAAHVSMESKLTSIASLKLVLLQTARKPKKVEILSDIQVEKILGITSPLD